MDEGFAMYYPVEKTGDATFGGPEADADPYAPSGDGVGIVYLHNTCTMNDFYGGWPCGGSHHSRGRMIGGVIYEISNSIGGEAGQILFDAFQITPQLRNFEELRARYVAADNARNSGANNDLIEQKFTERYLGGPDHPGNIYISLDGLGYPTVHWIDHSAVEEGYRVERKLNAGSWSVVADKAPNSTSFTENYKCTGSGSGTYSYRVQGYYENPGHPDEVSYSHIASIDLSTCHTDPRVDQALPPLETVDLIPVTTGLDPVHPNPFHGSTTLRYRLAEDGMVYLSVYDVLGREVAVLVNEVQQTGQHKVDFNATRLPSGLYIYRLSTGGNVFSGKMLLAR